MIILFSIIGLFILGTIVRGIFKDKNIAEKPKDTSNWIIQIVISIVIGLIVWAVIPKNCSGNSNYVEPRYEHE